MARFKKDAAAQKALANTVKLACGHEGGRLGHGPMWDLAESPTSIALLEAFYNSGKPIALVCHSPGLLRHVTYQGAPLVKGKHVAGFTNGEEEEMQLTKVVPFLVEDELLRLGAIFEKKANWQSFSITDGRLITGQNPASSTSAAQALLKLMAESGSESSTNGAQIGEKSYEMPPREGISVAHFLTVADIDRSLRFYETVFGGRGLTRATARARLDTFRLRIRGSWLTSGVVRLSTSRRQRSVVGQSKISPLTVAPSLPILKASCLTAQKSKIPDRETSINGPSRSSRKLQAKRLNIPLDRKQRR